MDDDAVRAEIIARFPPGTFLLVEVKRPEADPGWFAATRVAAPAGTLVVRLIPSGPEAYNPHAAELPGRGNVPEHVYHAVVDGFWSQNRPTLERLASEVLVPSAHRVRLGVWYEGYSRTWEPGGIRAPLPAPLPASIPAALAHATAGGLADGTPPDVSAHKSGSQPAQDHRWPLALSAAAAVAALVQFRRHRMAQARRGEHPAR